MVGLNPQEQKLQTWLPARQRRRPPVTKTTCYDICSTKTHSSSRRACGGRAHLEMFLTHLSLVERTSRCSSRTFHWWIHVDDFGMIPITTFHWEIDDLGMIPIKSFTRRSKISVCTYQTFHKEIDDFGMIPIKHFISRSTISV